MPQLRAIHELGSGLAPSELESPALRTWHPEPLSGGLVAALVEASPFDAARSQRLTHFWPFGRPEGQKTRGRTYQT